MLTELQESRTLFPEHEGLDRRIERDLANLAASSREKPAIVVCHILVPGEGVLYGIYLLVPGGETARGVRMENQESFSAPRIMCDALFSELRASGLGEAETHHLNYNTDPTW